MSANADERPAQQNGETSAHVFVSFTSREGGVAAHISTTRSGAEPRELFEPSLDCSRLIEAVVLTVTLLLAAEDQMPAESDAAAQPAPKEAPRQKASAPAVPIQPPSPPRATAHRQTSSALGAYVFVASGALPEPSWGLGMAGRWALSERWSLRAGADYMPVVEISPAEPTYRFSRSAAWIGVTSTLALVPSWTFALEAAAALDITHVAVIGDGGVDPGDFPFPALRGGLALAYKPARWLLGSAGLRGEVPIIRNVFRSRDAADPIWSQRWVGFAAEVGVAWHYW